MPVKWFIGPKGERVEFTDAPVKLERLMDVPQAVTILVINDLQKNQRQTHVRPSDLPMHMTCRRQKVWEAANDYGVDIRECWPMQEGTAIHNAIGTAEIEVPGGGARATVCGVEMRGRIDDIEGDTIVDYKTKSAYFSTRYGAKGTGVKPWIAIWEPDEVNVIKDYQHQLSICGVLLAKGQDVHTTKGKVHRIYRGVKAKDGAFKTYRFPLLTEERLEREIGPWLRVFSIALALNATNPEKWKDVPADGQKFVSTKGAKWACDRCPLREECDQQEGLELF